MRRPTRNPGGTAAGGELLPAAVGSNTVELRKVNRVSQKRECSRLGGVGRGAGAVDAPFASANGVPRWNVGIGNSETRRQALG